jgi:hypothetical protein
MRDINLSHAQLGGKVPELVRAPWRMAIPLLEYIGSAFMELTTWKPY